MEPQPSPAVFTSLRRRPCDEACLVLQAVGISSELIRQDGQWMVLVDAGNAPAAIAELSDYLGDEVTETSEPDERVSVFGGAIVGVIFYGSVLVCVAVLVQVSAYGIDWRADGPMRAGEVMSGQIWRTVTALTLHADASHLISNLVFGGVFGLLVGRILGGGVAWLAIVVAGALGNFGNAALRDAGHTSIGASTAVFAMLGILVAHALRPRGTGPSSAMRRWSPLIAGVLMLAFIGLEGERTDVLAHTTGFFAGILVGGAVCRLPDSFLGRESIQFAASAITFAILIGCWFLATLAAT